MADSYQEMTLDYRRALLRAGPDVMVGEIEKLRDMLGRAIEQRDAALEEAARKVEMAVVILPGWNQAEAEEVRQTFAASIRAMKGRP